MLFSYKGIDNQGFPVQGKIEAENQKEAINNLLSQGITLIKIEIEKEKKKKKNLLERIRKISIEDVSTFTIQLSTMLSAGVTLSDALFEISENVENERFKKVLKTIEKDITNGESLSESFKKHPQVFSELYVNMIKAGEEGGILEIVLKRISKFLENEIRLKNRLRTALTYPLVLLFVAVIVISFILIQFVPRFVEIFNKMGVSLPPLTLFLYKSSIFIKKFGFFIFVFLVIFLFLIKNYLKTPQGKEQIDYFKISLPIFGKLFQKISITRFLRTLSTLYGSGIPIITAIEIAGKVMDNKILEDRLAYVKYRLREGENLSEIFQATGIFEGMVIRMTETGEKSGALQEMLNKAADFYDLEIENTIERLSSLLEPLILLIMGGIVAFIMASTLIPMFQMVKMLRHY
jgi:type IV pilus assembly protein PilC